MTQQYTAAIRQDGEWWIGWVEEIPGVNGQERTREELLESLAEALADILELNREQARDEIGEEHEEVASIYEASSAVAASHQIWLRTAVGWWWAAFHLVESRERTQIDSSLAQ